jgi:hypothetical protein
MGREKLVAFGQGDSRRPEVTASDLAFTGNDLYAAGVFTSAGGTAATNIAKLDGTNWSALGSFLRGLNNCRGF